MSSGVLRPFGHSSASAALAEAAGSQPTAGLPGRSDSCPVADSAEAAGSQ